MVKSTRKGFTLIELLVVIAIIAILAAILFPIFVTAKRRAGEAQCLSNLKQIGSAVNLYLQDNGDRYPLSHAYNGVVPGEQDPGYNANAAMPNTAGLAAIVARYTKTPKIWMCPLGAKRKDGSPNLIYPLNNDNRALQLVGYATPIGGGERICSNYFSYPLNYTPADNYECSRGMSPAEALSRFGRIFTGPNGAGYKALGYECPQWNGRLIQDSYIPLQAGWRAHKGGTNILYHDGRVKFAKDPRPSGDAQTPG